MPNTSLKVTGPDTLYNSCLEYVIKHIEETIAYYDSDLDRYVLHDDLTLSCQLCEHLLDVCTQTSYVVDDKFMHIFCDPMRTRLKRICVPESYITDASLEFLMKHKPQELNVSGCISLTGNAVSFINNNGEKLAALLLGKAAPNILGNLLDTYFPLETSEIQERSHSSPTMDTDNDIIERPPQIKTSEICRKKELTKWGDKSVHIPDHILKCPALRAFSLHDLKENNPLEDARVSSFFEVLFKPLEHLTYLDVTNCHIGSFQFLQHTPLLTKLILHNVPICDLPEAVSVIRTLVNLRVLDLSQDKDNGQHAAYPNPEANLCHLVSTLPHLTRLDLSATNLAGFVKPKETEHRLKPDQIEEEEEECGIPGLEGRELDFLGLLNCPYDACQRENLPARQVTGDANENQVILSVKLYIDRPELLLKSLNNMFAIFKYQDCSDQITALYAIVKAMRKHPFDKTIQISGSASLFYIIKGSEKDQLTEEHKRMVVTVILDGMDSHMDEATMLRNGCLTLCHLKIPQDVLFDYERMVTILLRMVAPPQPEEFVQRIGIYLLNSLACQVDGKEKQLVGDLGAIKTMLQIINYKLDFEQCDEVMEIAWSTMWNVTDETAINCERFIKGEGMKLFLTCLDKFSDKDELLRNMMGLMGNIAEVEHLRPRLMQGEYVKQFSHLLLSTSDGIEVSYNACGVLAHMVADGEAQWTIQEPTRGAVLQKMVDAISRWNLKTNRNINYRSFEPILRLLPKYDTPEAQHWAVWALCNLTKMYRDKYCPLLEKEGGLPLLRNVAESRRPYTVISDLARKVLERCRRHQEDPEYRSEGEEAPAEEEEEDM